MTKSLILLVLTSLSLASLPIHAQKVITSQNGQKILINPDGTWAEYVESENADSTLIPISERQVEAQMAFDTNDQDEYQLLRTDIIRKYEEVKENQSKNKTNISVIKDEIKKAKKDQLDELALKRLEERKLQYYLSEYDLEKELDLIKPFKISVERIDNQGFNPELYQTLKQNYIAFAGDSYTIGNQQEQDINNDPTSSITAVSTEQTEESEIIQPITEAERIDQEIKRELAYYTFDTDDKDVMRNPPEVECKIKLKGIDKRTRKEKTELESGFLFGYTHPNIKSYFKEKDFLTCNAKLSKVGGLYYLSFEVRIASLKANKTYGSLDKGSGIRIKLINGETVNLYNISAATGFIEPLTGVTVYQTNYPMEKSEFKQLSKAELDKIGVIWSTGYEEYEIYEVDFLINQAECLKNS